MTQPAATGAVPRERVQSDEVRDDRLIPFVIAGICAAELVLQFVHVGVGAFLHAMALVCVLILQGHAGNLTNRRALAPLALIPLLRLLSLTAPLPGVPVPYWPAIIGVPLLVAGALAARSAGLGRRQIGLVGEAPFATVRIGLLGIPLGVGAWLCGPEIPWFAGAGDPFERGLIAVTLVVFVAFGEEFLFRGVIQGGLRLAYAAGSVPLMAILYGVVYLGSGSIGYTLYMTAVGALNGLIVARTGSILGVTISHTLLILIAFVIGPASGARP